MAAQNLETLKRFGVELSGNARSQQHAGYAMTHYAVSNVFVKEYAQAATAVARKASMAQRHIWLKGRLRSSLCVSVPLVRASDDDDVVAQSATTCTAVSEVAPGTPLRELLAGNCMPASVIGVFGDTIGRIMSALVDFKPLPDAVPTDDAVQAAVDGYETGQSGYWDLQHCSMHLKHATAIADPAVRALAVRALEEAAAVIGPTGSSAAAASAINNSANLTRTWIHGDLHEDNLLWNGPPAVFKAGQADMVAVDAAVLWVVDWDDCTHTLAAAEPAIALAYILMPLLGTVAAAGTGSDARIEGAAAGIGSALLQALCRRFPLTATDAAAVLPLIKARLAISLISSARAAVASTEGAGATVHAGPAAKLLAWLYEGGAARDAALCGAWTAAVEAGSAAHSESAKSYVPFMMPPADGSASIVGDPSAKIMSPAQLQASRRVVAWLQAHGRTAGFHPVIAQPAVAGALPSALTDPAGLTWRNAKDEAAWPVKPFVYDFGKGASWDKGTTGGAGATGAADSSSGAGTAVASTDAQLGWGQYGEDRVIYTSEHFTGTNARTLHLGVDVGAPAGTPVTCPFDGVVHSWAYNSEDLDYGPAVVLKHVVYPEDNGAAGSAAVSTSTGAVQGSEGTGTASSGQASGEPIVFYTLYGHLSLRTIFKDAGADTDVADTPASVKALAAWQAAVSKGAGQIPFEETAASADAAVGTVGAFEAATTKPWTPRLAIGQRMKAGEVIGWLGAQTVNGGWPPHVHVQIQTEIDMGGWAGDYPGVCRKSDFPAYQLLTPDPNLMLRCPWVKPVGQWSP